MNERNLVSEEVSIRVHHDGTISVEWTSYFDSGDPMAGGLVSMTPEIESAALAFMQLVHPAVGESEEHDDR